MEKIKWYIVKELPYCLLHFLIEKKVLSKYVENIKANIQWLALSENIPISELIAKRLSLIKLFSERGILKMCVWLSSQEGHEFWSDINSEYQTYCFKNNCGNENIKLLSELSRKEFSKLLAKPERTY